MSVPTAPKRVLSQKELEQFYLQTRNDPAFWMDSGAFFITSDTSGLDGGRVVPMFPTRSQKFLRQTMNRFRAMGVPARLRIGKDRRRMVTTFFQMYAYGSCLSLSDESCAFLAHNKDTTENLFTVVRQAHNMNPYFKDAIKLGVSRVNEVKFEGSVGPHILRNSWFRAYTTGGTAKTKLLGQFLTKVHKTECPEIEDLNALNGAIGPALAKSSRAFDVEEATFKGSDNHFARAPVP